MDPAVARTLLDDHHEGLERRIRSLEADLAQAVEAQGGHVRFDDETSEGEDLLLELDRLRAMLASEQHALDLVERAQRRLRDGKYGACVHCAAPIPDERLEALPATELCVPCKVRRLT